MVHERQVKPYMDPIWCVLTWGASSTWDVFSTKACRIPEAQPGIRFLEGSRGVLRSKEVVGFEPGPLEVGFSQYFTPV